MKYTKLELDEATILIDERFYLIVNILLSEAFDDELENSLYESVEASILNHEDFIKYALEYSLFNRFEYHETKQYALHEIMLEVLLELTRIFKASLSNDYELLKELISYANDIANVVYDEVYRS